MRKYPLILDLETKYTFRQYDDPKKLGISVVGVYDYRHGQSLAFVEKNIHKLFPLLEAASYLVGYNIVNFDLPVLAGYYPGRIDHFAVFDLLEDIRAKIGRRLALNDLIQATLGKKKSGHGLIAIDLYKEGKWDELKRYCLDDVMLTKEIFEHGSRKGEVFYLDAKGKVAVSVNWKKYMEDPGKSDTTLTLPF